MKYFVALVLSLFSISAHAQTCTQFKIESGHIIVQVRVNGHGPYPMLLDTGAQRTMIDPSIATAGDIELLSSVTFHGLGADQSTARTAFADVTLDETQIRNVPVLVYRPNGNGKWMGVVGWDYLSRFNLAIDNTHNCVSLQVIP
jgi:predicted aspartyl protease